MGMAVPESSYADRCKQLAIVYPILYRETFNRRKLVHLRGFEPLTFGSVDRCSIQLSYRCVFDRRVYFYPKSAGRQRVASENRAGNQKSGLHWVVHIGAGIAAC
jgi:hypothetical protein